MGYLNIRIGRGAQASASVGRVDNNLAVNIGIIHTPAALLLVEPTEVAIPQNGSAVFANVTSNTTWVVL